MTDKAMDDKAMKDRPREDGATPKSDKLAGDTRPHKNDAKAALEAQQKSELPTDDWPGKGAA